MSRTCARYSLNGVALIAALFLVAVLPVWAGKRNKSPGHHPQTQSAGSEQPSSQSQSEVTLLGLGRTLQTEIAGGQKRSYKFEMTKGQYTKIRLTCSQNISGLRLADSAGTPIDQFEPHGASSEKTVEVVGEATAAYGFDVDNKSSPPVTNSCTIEVSAPRSASEKEVLLQRARELDYKANDLLDRGNFDEAAKPANEALEIRERELGADDDLLWRPLNALARISREKADYSKAQALYLRALKIQERGSSAASDALFAILNNLGIVYDEAGDLDNAEVTWTRALAVGEKVWGPDQPIVANTLVNLANLSDQRADYAKAESLLERALGIAEKAYGPNHPGIATVLADLSGVYAEKGDYLKAESTAQRAVSIAEKDSRPNGRRLGLALINLGDVYRLEGETEKAEPLYERALEVIEKTLGVEQPFAADTLNNLGEIHHNRRDFATAERYYQRSLAIRQKILGADHVDVGQSLDRLGTLYRDEGDYARAGPLYQRALAIREKALGPDHPDVVDTLVHISAMQMATGNYSDAEAQLARAIAISERNAELNLAAGSERQKLAYVTLLSSQLDEAITLSTTLAPEQAAARDLAFTAVLQRKGRVQDVLSGNLAILRKHLSAEDGELLDRFNKSSAQLARLVLGGPQGAPAEEHEKRIEALKEQREKLEIEISRRSAEFRARSQPVSIEQVRGTLPKDAALVEFVTYRRFVPTALTEHLGESRYAVYVLRPTGDVQWKELGAAGEIDRAIDALRQALREPARRDAEKLARGLDAKVMQPVRELAGDASHLLISPDGQLSLIPFEALVDAQDRFAVERFSITYLSAGRDLLRMHVPRVSKSGPLLIADPVFGEPGAGMVARAGEPSVTTRPKAAVARRSITTGSDLSSVYFAPLTGTAREARSIQSLFPDAKVLTGIQATKAALEQVEAPQLLHIATHGFFLRDTNEEAGKSEAKGTRAINASAKIENPLLRSGLALAGANLSKGEGDDGILTALEASNLNLWGTKLVTLSACDTGVGEVKNGEGVYGLRRAFFLAGTESLVMSLWPVSDYVTRELMTAYYTALKKGLGRGEALRQAQLAMLKRKDRQHPFYWASFIQAGEWANLNGQR
jgi:CHAT domain-containing protein/Tfp pilus assembly protein PilF